MRVLRVNETKPPCTDGFLVLGFALECRKGSRKAETTLFWNSSWSLGFPLNPSPPNDGIWPFYGLIRFEPFFGYLLFLLEKKTKSIRFCTKFYKKLDKILGPNCSSLLLRSKSVQRNQLHFQKSFRK